MPFDTKQFEANRFAKIGRQTYQIAADHYWRAAVMLIAILPSLIILAALADLWALFEHADKWKVYKNKGGVDMKTYLVVLTGFVLMGVAFGLVTTFLTGDAKSAPTDQVLITAPYCYSTVGVVQLDSSFPLKDNPSNPCYYTAYTQEFWDEVTKGVTFMWDDNIVQVNAIAVGWEGNITKCETTQVRYQESYYLGK